MANLDKIIQELCKKHQVDYKTFLEIEAIAKLYDGKDRDHGVQRIKQIEKILNKEIEKPGIQG